MQQSFQLGGMSLFLPSLFFLICVDRRVEGVPRKTIGTDSAVVAAAASSLPRHVEC